MKEINETKMNNKKRPWETSDIVREVPHKATSHSKRYVMGDGTEKEVFTFEPMHYYDEKKKQWCEIDNTLEEREDGYTASLGKYKAKVSRNDDNEAIEVKGEDGEGNISWEYLGTTDPRYNHARKPKKHRGGMRVHRADDVEGSTGNSVIYENVEGGVDIEYGLSASGVKENIIIKEKSKRYKYFFKLYVNAFKMQLSKDGKSVEFYKKSDEESKTPEFTMPAPFMYDATGEVCREVYYDFEPVTKDNEDEYLFTVTANEDWINSENRMFPITVDPQLIVRESENIITFYSEKTLKTNSTDSTGNSIVNVVQSDNIILSKEHNGNESVAYIGFKNKAYFSIAEIVSAKLVLNCKTSFANNTIMVNDNPISQSGTQLIMDVTEGLTKYQRYNLTTNSIGTFEFYSYGIYAPYVEITYTTDSLSNSHKRKLALVPCVDLIYNMNTGYPNVEFEAIKDESMGISISNIYLGKKGYASGFKLNLDEKFVKDQVSGKYVWTDKYGKTHYFSERFYYFNADGDKMAIESREYLRMDSDGRFWYDHHICNEDTAGIPQFVDTYEVFRELHCGEDYIATSRVQDIENAEWIEQREDKERELEENLENYRKALCDFVVIKSVTGETVSYVKSAEDYKAVSESVNGTSNLLLTKSDALSYNSILQSEVEIEHSKNRLFTQRKSIKESVELQYAEFDINEASITASEISLLITKNSSNVDANTLAYIGTPANDEDTEIDITFESDGTKEDIPTQFALLKKQQKLHNAARSLYPIEKEKVLDHTKTSYQGNTKTIVRQLYEIEHQIEDLDKQKKLLATQKSLLKANSEEYIKLGNQYYKDYLKLKAEYEYTKLHLPVAFIFDSDTIKGYNENGDLVSISRNGKSPVIIERRVYDEDGHVRIFSVNSQDGKAITFDYDIYGTLESITASNGTKTLYSGYGDYIRRATIADKIYEFEYDSGMLSRASDGNIRASLEYSQEGDLKSITHYSLIKKLEHNCYEKEVNEISKIKISYEYTDSGNWYYRIYPKIVFRDEKTENENVYIAGPGECYSYYEIINGLVSYAEKFSKGSYYTEKTVADKKILNKYPLESFDLTGPKETILYNLGQLWSKRVETEETKPDGTAYLDVKLNRYSYDKQGKLASVTITEFEEYPVPENEIMDEYIPEPRRIETSRSMEKYFYNSDGILVRKESYNTEEKEECGVSIEEYTYDENSGAVKICRYNSLDTSTKFYTENILDENGAVTATVDQTGRAKTVYEYDAFGNLVSEILPNGSRYAYGRNTAGKITSITHSSLDGEENSTQKLYTNGKLTEVRSGNNVTNYSYDAKGRLLSVDLNDTDGYVTYTYEGDNTDAEKTVATMKNGTVLTSTRNKLGNVIQRTRGDKTVDFEYDNENRVVKSEDSVSGEVEYTYDEEGNLTSVSSGDVAESYTYDEEGECLSERIETGDTIKTYLQTYKDTIAKPLDSISVDDITIRPQLDVNGRNIGKTIEVSGTKIAEEQIAYLKFGDRATTLPQSIKYGNSINGRYFVRDNIKYKYDIMGNITEVIENGITVAKYEYDALGRLSAEYNKAWGKTVLYHYDDNGNIISKHEYEDGNASKEVTKMYAYDNDSDRLLAYGDDLFEYDEIGNPTVYRGKSVEWSHGREMTYFDGNTFTYDARGRRVCKNNITFTYNSTGKLLKQSNGLEFIYDHTGLLAVEYNGSRYFYRKNVQNDIIALLDNDGNIVVKYMYDAWGNQKIEDGNGNEIVGTTHIGNLNPFRYRSYYYDIETNLYFLKTRYYDPEICRFTTIDDLKYLRPDTINGINLYAYCRNNPIKYMDSQGTLETDTRTILVTVYGKGGLPIVGHSILYIKKGDTWYEVQYTGDMDDKTNAVADITWYGEEVEEQIQTYKKLTLTEINGRSNAFFKLLGYVSLIHGDKTYDCVQITEDYSDLIIYDENGNAVLDESKVDWDFSESYWLPNHNCLHFAKSVLNTVESSSKTVEYYKKYSMTIVPSFYHWGYYFADKFSKYTDPLVEKAEQHLATSLPYITQILDSQRASWKAFSQLFNMPFKSLYLKYIEPLLR